MTSPLTRDQIDRLRALAPEISTLLDRMLWAALDAERARVEALDGECDEGYAAELRDVAKQARAALETALLDALDALDASRRDAERLDWMESWGVQSIHFLDGSQINPGISQLRVALDDARATLAATSHTPEPAHE